MAHWMVTRLYTRLLQLWLLMCLSSVAYAELPQVSAAAGHSSGTHASETLRDFSVVSLVDPSHQWSLADVMVQAQQTPAAIRPSRVYFSPEQADHWMLFRLHNPLNTAVERVLVVDEPFMLHADFYSRSEGQLVWQKEANGLAVPVSARSVPVRLPAIKLVLAAGETRTLAVRLQSRYPNVTAALYLSSVTEFLKEQRQMTFFNAAYLGALLALILYNLMLYLSLRDRLHLYYVLSTSCIWVFMFAYSGYVLLLDVSASVHHGMGNVINLGMVFFIAFAREIIQIRRYLPRLDQLLWYAQLLYCLVALLSLLDMRFYRLTLDLTIPVMTLLLLSGVYTYYRGQRMASYFLFGTGWYVVGMILLVGVNQGYFAFSLFGRYSVYVGSLIEAVVFSLALAQRIKLLQQKKQRTQQTLRAKERDEKQRLEALVKHRTQELEELNRQLMRLSQHDGLTGVLNRRRFDQILFHLEQRRSEQPVALILCDIDHFKRYNDTLGHQAGDDCLKIIAAQLQSCCPSEGHTARYGGEEFAIILPGYSLAQAGELAEQIRAEVWSRTHPDEEGSRVTLSCGVACICFADPDSSAGQLIARADKALYRSKTAGRNRVTRLAEQEAPGLV